MLTWKLQAESRMPQDDNGNRKLTPKSTTPSYQWHVPTLRELTHKFRKVQFKGCTLHHQRPSSFPSPTVHVHSGVTQPSSVLIPTMESHQYLQPPPPQTSSINPHVAVPPGFPLPPKPPLPHSPNLCFLAKLKKNIARCNGCGTSFKKDALENNIDAVAVIGRKERDWFPFVFSDSSKCWRMGWSQNHYYHPKVSCLKSRNPNFKVSDLTSLLHRIEGGFLVSNEMTRELRERFGDSILR